MSLILPVFAYYSFTTTGWTTYIPVIWLFGAIPLIELLFKPDDQNHSETEEKSRLNDFIYDFQIFLMIPIQLFLLGYFLFAMQESGLTLVDKI